MSAKIISVMGVKDGVGASGLAKDIAAASRKRGETVLLVDGDADHPGDLRLVCGDAAPWRSLPDLSRLSFDSDPAWTRAFLKTASGFSGLEIAAAGENAWSQVEPHLHRFDLVVCDLGSRFHSLAASFLKQSSLFVLAAGSSITHVEALKRKSQKLSMSFFPFQRIGWVARNWGKEAFLKTADLEQITKIACVGQKGSDCLLTMDRLPPLNGDLAPFLPDRLFGEKLPPVVVKAAEEPEAPQTVSFRPELLSAVKKSMETKGLKADQNEEGLREKVRIIIHEVLQDASLDIPSETDRDVLTRELLDELLGLGPLEKLLSHPHYSEILVNGLAPIFVEEKGRLQPTSFQFINLESLNKAIERILAPLGRRVDEASPMVDARLKDGSRVNIIIPPLALNGPVVSIRRFSKNSLSPEDWVRMGSVTEEMLQFLKEGVLRKMNILVSGGTGSGKTTLLNLLSSFIPKEERIITIEDAAELKLNQPHVVRLESRPANIEGKGMIAIRDLVRNSLRMRPDRIVVGECRGAEALDMLQAMNTGHDGSLTTLHANTPRDALSRLETLVMFAGMDLPSKAIREQIASAIDIIVQIARGADGSRKIVSIVKLSGMEGDVFTLEEIFGDCHCEASHASLAAGSGRSNLPWIASPLRGSQ